MIRIQSQRYEWILALSAKIDAKFGCMGGPSNNCNFRIEVQGHAMLIWCLNVELMSIYSNLSFVRCQQSCGILWKPECYMINVLKINCGLIPIPASVK